MTDLKTAKEFYKQTRREMGIYQIKNLASGKIYLGRSADLNGKFNSERFLLKNGMHVNKELQNDFTMLGEEKFVFEILDRLQPRENPDYDYSADLQTLESMWLEKLQPVGPGGYHRKKP